MVGVCGGQPCRDLLQHHRQLQGYRERAPQARPARQAHRQQGVEAARAALRAESGGLPRSRGRVPWRRRERAGLLQEEAPDLHGPALEGHRLLAEAGELGGPLRLAAGRHGVPPARRPDGARRRARQRPVARLGREGAEHICICVCIYMYMYMYIYIYIYIHTYIHTYMKHIM